MQTNPGFPFLLTLLLTLFSTTVLAGKPPGGGGEEPPPPPEVELPPIEYVPTYIAPAHGTAAGYVNDFSDSGVASGYYFTPDNEPHAWIYNATSGAATSTDLNDLAIKGLDPDWVIISASGVNNNGLVVGSVAPFANVNLRRGYVLDLSTLTIYAIPDNGWDDMTAHAVNDNGDVLGYAKMDGSPSYAYLYNPGLRTDPGYDFEIVDIDNSGSPENSLRNSGPGAPAEIVGSVYGVAWRYVRGSSPVAVNSGNPTQSLKINTLGDVAGQTVVLEEVTVRKNRTEVVQTPYLYRNTDGDEEFIVGPTAPVQDFSDAGSILVASFMLYVDGWETVDVLALTPGGNSLSGATHQCVMNNFGPVSFGQIATTTNTEIVIFTAHRIESP